MEANYARSTDLLRLEDSLLVVVDVQEKLVPHIANGSNVQANVARMVRAARIAGVPIVSTEQYPKGLGPTTKEIASQLESASFEKLAFSCMGSEEFRNHLVVQERRQLVVCGLETHVCIQQTVFDLMAEGFHVFLVLDAIGARKATDHEVAIRRMEAHGVVSCTVESCLFEWCKEAGTPLFREIRKLVVE
jgi:nicotinamidase-related amidase